jgi:hypothetical protein
MTEPSDAANAAPKQRGKPFPKGRSGNQAGKRPGTRHRATIMAEQLMAGDLEAVIAKVVKKAKAGDMTAAKMILDRLAPVRKGSPVKFSLPPIVTVDDVVSAQTAITAAMSSGRLTPTEAVEVSAVVELARRAIETGQLEARLAAIENRMGSDDDQKL